MLYPDHVRLVVYDEDDDEEFDAEEAEVTDEEDIIAGEDEMDEDEDEESDGKEAKEVRFYLDLGFGSKGPRSFK